ncbi:RhoGEF domain protein [Ceratocystis platani]|uniref:RhoGEF domain protein n=1 Tax=Ceratocystis fimbriata f. sp. platani TaxID=88771 RepID=A0A0F8D9W7_CERFI|nr:RhoGEF domain protein [Ceratocystis platani]
MVRVTDDIVLPSESVTLYHSCDPLLGEHPVLVFHGPSTTANYTHNSSRVQVHVFSAAGFQSFHRLTISPNSPFYTVVDYLPREFQGDEVYRGLAFGLFKYFSELPESVKLYLRNRYANTRLKLPGPPPVLFGEQHAADLAKELVQSNNTVDVVKSLQTALQTQHISNVDLDFVLPPGSIVPLQAEDYEDYTDDEDDILDPSLRQYGGYTPLVRLLGESVFLPTSRLRRAPSKPTSLNRGKAFSKDQKFDLRMKLCELVDTEQRYVKKVNELVNSIAADFRKAAQAKTPESQSPTVEEVDKLFPESLDTILNLNTAFMHELRKVMDDSEEEAQKDMEHTSRDFLRELDKPSAAGLMVSMTNAAGGTAEYDLLFMGWHDLADVRFTESDDGQLVWMTSVKDMKRTHVNELSLDLTPTSRCFRLQETFEGKANRWTEDIAKARVEGRFAEAEREDPRWTLRSIRMPDSNLGLFAAVFQEGADYLVEGRKEPAPIRVVIDHERGTKGAPIGHYGVDIVVNVGAGDLRRLSINAVGLGGKAFHDEVALEDFLPTLSRRIIQLMSSQLNVWNPNLVPALVSYYTKTVKGLNLTGTREKSRSFLATSPVKLLSNIWNGTLSSAPDQPRELQRSGSQHSIFGSIRGRDRVPLDDAKPENPLVRLEGTFTGYVAALQQRKGNILGRAVMNRGSVDELAVNDLYNRLIEAPFDFEYSSDLGADVILVAFEKFLRIAWTEQMGPIMTMNALDKLQARLNRRVPGDFADFVNYLFGDMAPQNRRAFTSLIKLLADLLDGCGNDSDRGALTLAFAEILVPQDDAANYMNLLDRLVEDCDRIFDESGNIGAGGAQNALLALANANGYLDTINGSGTMRGIKSHSGSLTSNTSSLRRKFGFDTLLRQNSKDSTHSDNMIRPPRMKENIATSDIFQPPSAGGSSKGATPITASPSPTISDFDVMKEPREREEGSKLPQRIQTKGLSNIPTLKPRENLRPNSPTRGTGQRLRLQSPQRLRERLQSEKQAAAEVDASLKSELSKITEDMARVGNSAVGGGRHNTPEFRRLAAAVRNLEEQIPTAIHEVSGRHESLQRDMEMTMKAHEAKVVEIDTLYQKTALENKALYDRFNTELVKIVKAVKGKGREDKEELLGMMTQQGEEVAKLRKDNLKLKRELASLRAAVKGLDIQVPNPNPNPGQPSA